MNLTTLLSRFVESNALAPVREAQTGYLLGSGIDNDEHLYRSLSQTTRDLPQLTMDKQRELAFTLSDINPFAKRIINLTRDFVVGDTGGWKITATNPKVQELLDEHWSDPQNKWPQRIKSRVRELGLSGEQCYTARTGMDGIVRLGYVDPGFIQTVSFLPHDHESYDVVTLKKAGVAEEGKKLRVVRYDPAEKRLVGAPQHGDAGYVAGGGGEFAETCFFWALNKPIRATRGRSDLLCLGDVLDMVERFHWNRLENRVLQNAFAWHHKLEGATVPQLKDYARENAKAPRPGSSWFTNEKVTIEAVTPNLQSSDASEEGRLMRTPMLVGSGFPEHWLFGQGENANRASAYEMADPPIRMLSERREFVIGMLTEIFDYQIDEAIRLNRIPASEDAHEFTIDAPELSSRDLGKAAAILTGLTASLAVASGQWVTPKTAAEIYGFVVGQLGFTVDVDAEVAALGLDEEQGPPVLDEDDDGDLAGVPGEEEEEPDADEVPA